jgi:hypothetical protein
MMEEPRDGAPRERSAPDPAGDFPAGYSMDRLSNAFETSARRWELIVYPSLFAFIILAAYGFYLIFSLAKDVHYLAISVDSNMTRLATNMQSVSENMMQLSGNVRGMAYTMESISGKMDALAPMRTDIGSMDQSIKAITAATLSMHNDMAVLNRSISRPMSFMNSFMPW